MARWIVLFCTVGYVIAAVPLLVSRSADHQRGLKSTMYNIHLWVTHSMTQTEIIHCKGSSDIIFLWVSYRTVRET